MNPVFIYQTAILAVDQSAVCLVLSDPFFFGPKVHSRAMAATPFLQVNYFIQLFKQIIIIITSTTTTMTTTTTVNCHEGQEV